MIKRFFEKPIRTISIAVCIFVYRILLDLIYGKIVSTLFAYAGFPNHYSIGLALFSWVLFFVSLAYFLIITQRSQKKPSLIVTQLIYFVAFVPYTTCLKFGMFTKSYTIYSILFWVMLFGIEFVNISVKTRAFPRLTVNTQNVGTALLWIIAAVSCGVTLYLSYKYTGFRLHFNLLTVYDLRKEAESFNMPTIVRYLYSWTRAINPFMIAYCFLRRNRILTILFAACALLNFGFDGSKTSLFYPLLFLGIAIICRKYSNLRIEKMLVFVFLFVALAGLLEYLINKSFYISSYFVRRLMMVENLNSTFYYDFFSANTPDYFRMSFLRYFGFTSPYSDLAKMIGEVYLGTTTNANCGLIADAVTNFGKAGFIGYPVMFFILMRLFDKLSVKVSKGTQLCVALYISIQLVNSFMMTSLLTHGILIIFILLYCASGVKDKTRNRTGSEIPELCVKTK